MFEGIAPSFLDTFLVHIMLTVFEIDGRQDAVSGMFGFRVIEHFDVVEVVLSGLLAEFACSTTNAFTIEQVEDALGNCSVMAIIAPAYRMLDIGGCAASSLKSSLKFGLPITTSLPQN